MIEKQLITEDLPQKAASPVQNQPEVKVVMSVERKGKHISVTGHIGSEESDAAEESLDGQSDKQLLVE